MNDFALRLAIAAACGWTKFYTWGLPFEQRSARCEEVESDIWESVNDATPDRRTLALQIAARLILGIPDDLGWRAEHAAAGRRWRWRVALAAVAVAMFGLWVNRATPEKTHLSEMLKLVPAPHVRPRLIDMPPPPPPPPPCPPPSFPQPSGRCTK